MLGAACRPRRCGPQAAAGSSEPGLVRVSQMWVGDTLYASFSELRYVVCCMLRDVARRCCARCGAIDVRRMVRVRYDVCCVLCVVCRRSGAFVVTSLRELNENILYWGNSRSDACMKFGARCLSDLIIYYLEHDASPISLYTA